MTDLQSALPDLSALGDGGAEKVMLVGSGGGHLAQLLALKPWWVDLERTWVCFDGPDARDQLSGERVAWAFSPTTRNLVNLVRNFFLAIKLLRRESPDVVISTGAGVAVPFFFLARVMGIPTIYVEVIDRVSSRTLTGRLCRPMSSAFCVQWREQAALYPGSVVVGPLL
ncbi:MAG TPA: PssD/Cps14F family polysaccharide biosynthesis glycosyltransferase [Frankiaceae bacterium]|nr:PssD/Cps14F family polysaccharide biosynthesis glycosyltransferase [Frankiaceae bacterium]